MGTVSEQINPVRGFMCSVGVSPRILVRFQFNPTQLSDKRTVSYAALNAPAMLMPVRQYSQGGDRTLSFNVRVDGLFNGPSDPQVGLAKDADGSIWPELNKYRAFLYPKTPRWRAPSTRATFTGLYRDVQEFQSPPICLFGFGEHRIMKCLVTDVSINEVLFNEKLAPLRAEVSVTLVELMPYDPSIFQLRTS